MPPARVVVAKNIKNVAAGKPMIDLLDILKIIFLNIAENNGQMTKYE
jgi:hypothetical protein